MAIFECIRELGAMRANEVVELENSKVCWLKIVSVIDFLPHPPTPILTSNQYLYANTLHRNFLHLPPPQAHRRGHHRRHGKESPGPEMGMSPASSLTWGGRSIA